MRHIEEHILELHVLGSEKVADRREEILAHLGECHGCRHLAEQMAEFYRETETELKNLSSVETRPQTSLVRSHRDLQKLYEPTAPAIPLRTPTRIERFGIFVRRHPVVGAVGGASLFGALALLISTAIQTIGADGNPEKAFLSLKSGTLRILDRNERLLWERTVPSLQTATDETRRDFEGRVKTADLNHDGRNEVITTLPFLGDNEHGLLRVLRFDSTLLLQKDLSHEFQYANREYTSLLKAGRIFVDEFGERGEKQIVVYTAGIRSPSAIVRVDAAGNEVGRYWHFGNFTSLTQRDIDGDGKQEILAGGSNDTEDSTSGEFPCIVVLTPSLIVGQGKSATCDQFQFPFSTAEMYYIRLPIPDIYQALRTLPSTINFDDSDSSRMIIGSSPSGGAGGFYYVFDSTMGVVEVKSSNHVAILHAKAKEEGKLTSTLDKTYLENLRQGVRYWDGKGWRKEVVRVKHNKAEGN